MLSIQPHDFSCLLRQGDASLDILDQHDPVPGEDPFEGLEKGLPVIDGEGDDRHLACPLLEALDQNLRGVGSGTLRVSAIGCPYDPSKDLADCQTAFALAFTSLAQSDGTGGIRPAIGVPYRRAGVAAGSSHRTPRQRQQFAVLVIESGSRWSAHDASSCSWVVRSAVSGWRSAVSTFSASETSRFFFYGRPPRSFFHPLNFYELATSRAGQFSVMSAFSWRAFMRWRELQARYRFDVVHDVQVLGYGSWMIHASGMPMVANIHHPLSIDRMNQMQQATRAGMKIRKANFYPFFMQEVVARRMDRIITGSHNSRASVQKASNALPHPAAVHGYKPLHSRKRTSQR